MFAEISTAIIMAVGYICILEFLWNDKKGMLFEKSGIIAISAISFTQILVVSYDLKIIRTILPLIIMIFMIIYGIARSNKPNRLILYTGVMGAYVIVVFINIFVGACIGMIAVGFRLYIGYNMKMIIANAFRLAILILLWKKYEWLQEKIKISAVNILVFIGAFVLFFQQFFRTAYGEKEYNFAVVLILLIYLTMIFTAFMLLQHNRLTAKQQAIEEDNRQMSQRLHRSKDVLGVVSQVVASEDHIDPKLRKELADFCDDEMNEMQDRALGANLIGDTGIELVNVMLQKQMMRCADLNISFDVMIPAPIDGYIREIGISVTEFMRMLNDLLKNAVKAILSSDNTHRELLLIMGEAGNDCFEIRLYDSGVPFPPKILEHLGERGNTTDGTGNGIADTVETLRHYRASFVIEPIEPGTDIYTKCIHIAFDEQGCLPQNGEQ